MSLIHIVDHLDLFGGVLLSYTSISAVDKRSKFDYSIWQFPQETFLSDRYDIYRKISLLTSFYFRLAIFRLTLRV